MEFTFLRREIIFLTALTIGHLPVPWVHRHEGADALQLTSHLNAFHCGVSDSQPPQSWHVHFHCFSSSGDDLGDGYRAPSNSFEYYFYDDSNPLAFESESDRLIERVSDTDSRRNLISNLPLASAPPLIHDSPTLASLGSVCARVQIYRQFCSLLL